ncbi:esterase-like activity of phytase family protein [Eilatimonas milleporae]|uniref:Phytase-like protein with esterase activity n=1 Tax=Eilatimonas milleporae TaxID=911205 RepID=A0A3M0CD19_9PROT|nr:esterase-like activity of phytase family protein [Eilatimonas milleporae]RMB07724.1 phytase-like protein with esterase activity [Eilatimonas milleporae]
MNTIFQRLRHAARAATAVTGLGLTLGLTMGLALPAAYAQPVSPDRGSFSFNRIASFPVHLNASIDQETVSEIVTAAENGTVLLYTDGEQEAIGFVDITDPASPQADGIVALSGEPTSVGVIGNFALAAVNTSPDFVNPSGVLEVIDITARSVVRTIDLGGQPDAVAVSADGQYAAIAIENERDEDLGDGRPPQAPGGSLVIVDIADAVADWSIRTIDLAGIADLFPDDPEPEYVDISADNTAAVTLQENNHIILVDLATGNIVGDFSAGTTNLRRIDVAEEDVITLTGALDDVPREPDGIAWIGNDFMVTADEGDLDGGSRGFTIFDRMGNVVSESKAGLDRLTARIGHYPEGRSENKGNEPENVDVGVFNGETILFVGSERSSVVGVYDVTAMGQARYRQVLPTGLAPEGMIAIPERGLFVSASEDDVREDKFRSTLSIYQLQAQTREQYPAVVSLSAGGVPITWAALSGLTIDTERTDLVTGYSVDDSFFSQSSIYKWRMIGGRMAIQQKIPLTENGQPVGIDPEGIAIQTGEIFIGGSAGLWIASEGNGDTRQNELILADNLGQIMRRVTLPEAVRAKAIGNGFEGVAAVQETIPGQGTVEAVYVVFQREWTGDPDGNVRIGRWVDGEGWTFAYYPIETPTSPNGGWVGLSGLAYLGNGDFAVLERDNQGNQDARIKLITRFSTTGIEFKADTFTAEQTPDFDVVVKTVVRDLIDAGDFEAIGGVPLEKIEGLAVSADGSAYVVNDNDGVDDSNGETQLFIFPNLFPPID